MEEVQKNNGQGLGIAALITAIITFVLAVIPCVGLIALIPGIIAVVLASVGLSQASRSNSPKGTLIAGLIIAIIAVLISLSQIFVVGKIASKADKWPKNFENIMEDIQDNVIKNMEDNNVNIRIESNGDTIEIKASGDRKDKMDVLEDLEGDSTAVNDSATKK